MGNFFKSLFQSKEENNENEKIKNEKKNFEIFKFDGLRAQRMGRADYAVKCFINALDIEEDFETMGYLSQLYIQTHELDKARQLLNRMAQLEPQLTNTWVVMANVCYMQEDYTEMVKAAQKAVELENENATAHFLLAKAYQGLQDDIMTIGQLTQAITLKSNFMEAILTRVEVLLHMQQYTNAQEDIDAALELNPEEETALLLRGKLKQATGDYEGAEADYQQVTEFNPFNEQAYIDLAQLYIARKKLNEAIELLDEAIELNPHSATAYHERGRAKLLNGDKDGSLIDMKQALEFNPKETEKLSGQFDNQSANQTNVLGI